MLAIMVRKFQERNPLALIGKALDFEMRLQERNEKFVYLLEIKFFNS